jgi:prophage endopeptidase
MICALAKRYWLQLIVVAVIGGLAFFANHYHDNATKFKEQRDKATVRAETAETVSNSVVTAMNLINDISRVTQNAKTELSQAGEQRVIYIRQALEGDQCAKQLVPAAAADSLREYADGLRAGTRGTDKR